MDRETYIKYLTDELKGYPSDDLEAAIEYVNEYYDEAQSPEDVIKGLGTPRKFAAQIKADSVLNSEKSEGNKKGGSGFKTLIIVLLGIFSLPVSVPLILVVFAIMFAIFMAAFGIILALVAVGLSIPLGVFFVLGSGIAMLTVEPVVGVFLIGLSFIGISISILIVLLIYWVIKYAVAGIVKFLSWIYNKIRGRNR